MHAFVGGQFNLEIHPADWRFGAEESWIAGWIKPNADEQITDVRARLQHRVILGLFGLPHPAFAPERSGELDSARPGFSFLFCPQPGETLLRLEVRMRSGEWKEFFRTAVSPAPDAPPLPAATNLSESLGHLATTLIKRRRLTPWKPWSILADELVATFVAEPLNAHPNLPFVGALEEPHAIGRLRYGLIPVTGWLAHPTAKITRLSAVIDPLAPVALPHGLARQDIPGIFPALGNHANSAFVGEIALPPDLAAPVLLKIFAELDTGEIHLAFARRFTPKFHFDLAQMPPLVPPLTFTRAIWALYRAAGNYALPRHGVINAARAVWANYSALPAYRPKRKHLLLEKIQHRSAIEPSRQIIATTEKLTGNKLTAATSNMPDCRLIAPADDMCVPDASHYLQIGREALAIVQDAVALAGCKRIDAILDLPSGHGRVARWLRTAYPTARLSVSDTQRPGVIFCIEHMGATGVQADVEGNHWAALPGSYDIIWCGSLLTHFGRTDWINHLRRFAERLSPSGVLVFTTHGFPALERLQGGEKDYGLPQSAVAQLCATTVAEGFGYVDYPDTPAYGISVSLPPWVLELIEQETELQVIDLREAAWDQHQDVVVCTRRAPGRTA